MSAMGRKQTGSYGWKADSTPSPGWSNNFSSGEIELPAYVGLEAIPIVSKHRARDTHADDQTRVHKPLASEVVQTSQAPILRLPADCDTALARRLENHAAMSVHMEIALNRELSPGVSLRRRSDLAESRRGGGSWRAVYGHERYNSDEGSALHRLRMARLANFRNGSIAAGRPWVESGR